MATLRRPASAGTTRAMKHPRSRIGDAPKRREDPKFLTGEGAFLDDLAVDGLCHAVFLRSPHAHARIAAVDCAAARAATGVIAGLTRAQRVFVPDWCAAGAPYSVRSMPSPDAPCRGASYALSQPNNPPASIAARAASGTASRQLSRPFRRSSSAWARSWRMTAASATSSASTRPRPRR